MLFEAGVGDDASMRQAVHAFPDFDEDAVVFDEGGKLVLVHDGGGNFPSGNPHVFEAVVEIKVFKSIVTNRAPGAETILLKWSLAVVRSAGR
jgi:hypothetical protein